MIYFKCNSFNFPIMFNFTHDLITYAHPHLSLMLSVFFLHSFIIILQSWNYVYGRPWIKYVIINNVSCARNNRMSIIFLFFFILFTSSRFRRYEEGVLLDVLAWLWKIHFYWKTILNSIHCIIYFLPFLVSLRGMDL